MSEAERAALRVAGRRQAASYVFKDEPTRPRGGRARHLSPEERYHDRDRFTNERSGALQLGSDRPEELSGGVVLIAPGKPPPQLPPETFSKAIACWNLMQRMQAEREERPAYGDNAFGAAAATYEHPDDYRDRGGDHRRQPRRDSRDGSYEPSEYHRERDRSTTSRSPEPRRARERNPQPDRRTEPRPAAVRAPPERAVFVSSKQDMCYDFTKGRCLKGDSCFFSHAGPVAPVVAGRKVESIVAKETETVDDLSREVSPPRRPRRRSRSRSWSTPCEDLDLSPSNF